MPSRTVTLPAISLRDFTSDSKNCMSGGPSPAMFSSLDPLGEMEGSPWARRLCVPAFDLLDRARSFVNKPELAARGPEGSDREPRCVNAGQSKTCTAVHMIADISCE